MPFVVRPADDGGYTLIGECYVQDLMHGEAVAMLSREDGQVSEDWIRLV
jgi:hypothetical protein